MKTFMDFLETETGNTKTKSFIDDFLGTLIEDKVLDQTILKEDRMTTLVNGIVVGLLIKDRTANALEHSGHIGSDHHRCPHASHGTSH